MTFVAEAPPRSIGAPQEPIPVPGQVGYREGRFTAQDGLSLYYRDYGDPGSRRLPLLCLSGLTRNSRDFERFALERCHERRIVSPDYRGRGRSAWDPDWRNYQGATYLNDLLHLLTVTGIERCVVVGTSMGGILALALCAFRPTAVAGVVLNDIGPDVAPEGLGRIVEFISIDRPQPDWPTAERFIRDTLSHLPIRDEATWREVTRGTFREGSDGLLHFDYDTSLVRGMAQDRATTPDLWPLFRGARRLPMLALRGEASDVLTAQGLERMVAERPDLRHVTVPERGHVPSLTEPASRRALDDFLAQF
jgi:pimeloyl-ACP methyl ester carboxylesterase